LLRDPAFLLEIYNLKLVLQRLAPRDLNRRGLPDFPFDPDPVRWYIYLNLLAHSNSTGTFNKLDPKLAPRFELNILGLFMHKGKSYLDMIVTETRELEGITCYRKPFMSFHMYSSPFVLDLWVLIVLGIIVLSIFLNGYIYFNHKDIVSSISPTLLSISLLANVSYYIPKSLYGIQMYSCWRAHLGY